MRVLSAGALHDLAALARESGGRWDDAKVARAEQLIGDADGFEAASYLTSLFRDPRTTFEGGAKQKLQALLVGKLDVDEAELKGFKVPDPIALEYKNAAQNANKFYGLEVRGSTLTSRTAASERRASSTRRSSAATRMRSRSTTAACARSCAKAMRVRRSSPNRSS
jgi:hypothetical protein